MISREKEAEILRLHHAEGWKRGTIARQLGVHPDVVLRVLAQEGGVPKADLVRKSMIEPYVPFIERTLELYPELPASSLFAMCCKRGYKGGQDHFRHLVALFRPRPAAEAFLRLRTLPGEQAQVDWGHFGYLKIGSAIRKLMAFVLVLSFSRWLFLRFFLGSRMANFLRGHEEAFSAMGGLPRDLLYDNLKSAVLERVGDAIHFNPLFLEFAAHHHFKPKPVAKGRGNEKGRVESAIRYVRRSFFMGRDYKDLDDLNAQAWEWCQGPVMRRRCPEDEAMTVADAFAHEKPLLLPLPANHFPVEERVEVSVGKTPYARFDLNDYSVPHDHVRRVLVVRADEKLVRIFDGEEIIATHSRSFDRKKLIEDSSHIQALVEAKREAHAHRGLDRLRHAVKSSKELFWRLAQTGANLGGQTSRLLMLLDTYGAERLEAAIAEALEKNVLHHHAIRHILERDLIAKGEPPPLPVILPDDPRVRDLAMPPQSLGSYDKLIDGSAAADKEEEEEEKKEEDGHEA